MNKLALLALLPTALSAQVLLTDDFNDSTINPTLWNVILPNGSSSVIESGGVVTTTARGVLGTVASFTAPYEISGTFTMLNDFEHFNIVFRSDLSGSDFGHRRGLFVSFANDGNGFSIQRYNNSSDTSILAQKSYPLNTNQQYSFAIADDGNLIVLSVGGNLELSTSSNFSTGSKIGFHSREFGSTATSVDSFTVTAIPEPASFAILIGFISLGFVITKRKR